MNLVLLLHFSNQNNSTDNFNDSKYKNKAFLEEYSIPLISSFTHCFLYDESKSVSVELTLRVEIAY